jgi:hypothetical protein
LNFVMPGFSSPTPIPSLGGGFIRLKPLVPIEVIGPRGRMRSHILVDTAADDVVFPVSLAAQIGVDLSHAPSRTLKGVGGAPAALWFAPVIRPFRK